MNQPGRAPGGTGIWVVAARTYATVRPPRVPGWFGWRPVRRGNGGSQGNDGGGYEEEAACHEGLTLDRHARSRLTITTPAGALPVRAAVGPHVQRRGMRGE